MVALFDRGGPWAEARSRRQPGWLATPNWRERSAPAACRARAHFTLGERLVDGSVNAVVIPGAGVLAPELAAGDPSVRAVVGGDALVLCTEALTAGEVVDEIVSRAALRGTGRSMRRCPP
jgi:hypothetical protein